MDTKSKEDIFFNSASEASLSVYSDHGKIPFAVSALIKNKDEYELIPLSSGLPELDARLVHTIVDYAIKPLIKYVCDNKDSDVLSFFLSVIGEGQVQDLDDGGKEDVKIIINATRTKDGRGKTNVFKIVDKNTFVKLTLDDEDGWKKTIDENNLPEKASQYILDIFWKEYIIAKNMSSIKIS